MGKGLDLARAENPELAAAIDDMKDQLLIVLVRRLGGAVTVPVKEIDGTGGFVMEMELVGRTFEFTVRHKQ